MRFNDILIFNMKVDTIMLYLISTTAAKRIISPVLHTELLQQKSLTSLI